MSRRLCAPGSRVGRAAGHAGRRRSGRLHRHRRAAGGAGRAQPLRQPQLLNSHCSRWGRHRGAAWASEGVAAQPPAGQTRTGQQLTLRAELVTVGNHGCPLHQLQHARNKGQHFRGGERVRGCSMRAEGGLGSALLWTLARRQQSSQAPAASTRRSGAPDELHIGLCSKVLVWCLAPVSTTPARMSRTALQHIQAVVKLYMKAEPPAAQLFLASTANDTTHSAAVSTCGGG